MTPVSPEILAAYLDGELDEPLRAELERAMAADPELARRVGREIALRGRLQSAYAAVLDEPVPERLRQALNAAPAAEAPGQVVDLAEARAARRPAPAPEVRQRRSYWGAMAASVLLGFFVARLLPDFRTEPFETTSNGQLVARGAVGEALSTRLASQAAAAQDIGVQVSFVDDTGRFCRTFTTHRFAGLACREGDDWAVLTLAPGSARPTSEMRTAGSALPASILAEVDRRIQGAPLNAQAEQAARDGHWKR